MLSQIAKADCFSLESRLYHSVINNDEETFKAFLDQGVDVHLKVKGPLTCIHIAVQKEYLKIVEHLLLNGADANSRFPVTENRYTGSTLLYRATAKGNEALVSLLLEYNADVKAKNKDDSTALHIAAEKGHLAIVQILLQKGAQVNFKNDKYDGEDFYREQFLESQILRNELNLDFVDVSNISKYEGAHSPLHLAIKARHENVTELLFKSGADVNARDSHGDTALSLSVQSGSLEIFNQVLNHSPIANNCGNKRALSYAVKFQSEKHQIMIKELLKLRYTFDSYLENFDELLPEFAITNGHFDIIYKIFDKDEDFGADPEENRKSFASQLLEEAIKEGNVVLSKFLFEQGASLEKTFRLSELGNLKKISSSLVELLITNGLDVRNDPAILVHAAQKSMHELIQFLLDNESRVNSCIIDDYFLSENCSCYLPLYKNKFPLTDCKISPLFVSAALGDLASVKLLLKYGANVQFKMDDGLTPFLIAVINGHLEVVEILLKFGVNIESTDFHGRTSLYLAAEFGHEKVVRFLLRCGAKIDARMGRLSFEGLTPFLTAAEEGHLKVIKTLIELDTHNNIIQTMDNEGKTALHYAAKNGHSSVVKFLLEHGVNVNKTDNDEGETALFNAAMNGHVETVKQLLECGANVRIFNPCDKNPPLYFAVSYDQLEVIKLLLEYGADPNITRDYDFDAPLTISAGKGNLEIVDLLIKFGANVNYYTPTGETALSLALKNDHTSVVNLLRANGAQISSDKQRNQALLCCAKNGNLNCIEFLLKDCVEMNFTDCDGQTALHLAAACGHINIVQLLLKFGFNINALDKKMRTPLILSSEKGHLQIVETLLKSGANFEIQDHSGRTALYVSAENGHKGVVNILIESGSNFNHRSKKKTPLIIAAERGHFETVKALVEGGADINCSDKNGHTALYFAAEYGHVDTASLLLNSKAEINTSTGNGKTPLIVSSERGHLECVKIFLQKNANIHSSDEQGLTAIHYASELGHCKVVKLLLEHCANISCEARNDVSLLTICAKKGFYEIVDTLMKFGVKFDLTNRPDLTEDLATTLHKWDLKVFSHALEYFSADYKFPSVANLRSFFDIVNKRNDIDDEMTDKEESNYNNLAKTLVRFFTKMKAANMYSNEESLFATVYCDEAEIGSFENECKLEIDKMSCETIGNSDVLVYDILKVNLNRLASFARNNRFPKVLKSLDFTSKFPLYYNLIYNQYDKGKVRRRLIDECVEVCQKSFMYFALLPSNIIEDILLYMTNRDLRSLLVSNYHSCNNP